MHDTLQKNHLALRFMVGILVLALHGALLYALWHVRPSAKPEAPTPVFVRWMETPASTAKVPPSVPVATPEPPGTPPSPPVMAAHIAATPNEAPAPSGDAQTAAVGGASTAADATPASASLPSPGAVPVASGLSLSCPVRTAPAYPALARKMGETGKVQVRVELDEGGALVSSEVVRSSGFARLDAAALAAVKTWRCGPALRDGRALRVVSMESFEFNLNAAGH